MANHKAKVFKCLASEMWSLMPVFAFFLQAMLMPHDICVKEECACILAYADMLDLFILGTVGDWTPNSLREAIRVFIDACLAAGWKNGMTPKFH